VSLDWADACFMIQLVEFMIQLVESVNPVWFLLPRLRPFYNFWIPWDILFFIHMRIIYNFKNHVLKIVCSMFLPIFLICLYFSTSLFMCH
jgi:hypothetical protein